MNIELTKQSRAAKLQKRPPIWLFLLFFFYGPSIGAVGELRYVEIVVLAMLLLNAPQSFRFVGRWEKRLICWFALTAFVQVVSDLVNDAAWSGTLKRAGTYTILALLIVALKWMSRGDIARIRLMLAGYCASYVFILFVGTSTSPGYEAVPWRLGLGTATATAICLLITWIPRFDIVWRILLVVFGTLLLTLEARLLCIITVLTGLSAICSLFSKHSMPNAINSLRMARFLLMVTVGITSMYAGLGYITENKWLPPDVQSKMEAQLASPYGLLAAGRPDCFAAMFAITKRPILGFGSTGFDDEVLYFYAELAASAYIGEENYNNYYYEYVGMMDDHGIPSHSHLMGTWVDAGVIATTCWFVVLWLSMVVLSRAALWKSSLSPLFIFVALLTIWDILFSPGPHRMDMAFRLLILVYAVEYMQTFVVNRPVLKLLIPQSNAGENQ